MTTEQIQRPLHGASIFKRAIQGALLAFSLLAVFLISIVIGTEETMGTWMLVPLGTVCVGGAGGGVFFYLMDFVRQYGQAQKIAANIICVPAFIVSSWLGMVYGLALVGLWD